MLSGIAMSYYNSSRGSPAESLYDYDMVSDAPHTDNDDLSEFDTNSILSTSDFELDTPDDNSTGSEDNLDVHYHGDSDSESVLGGDTTYPNDASDSTPSSSMLRRNTIVNTPSVVSFDSDKDDEFSESILNNPLSYPASLTGSSSALKIPTASTLLSRANHKEIFNPESDVLIHGHHKSTKKKLSVNDVFRICPKKEHYHCNAFTTQTQIKKWNLTDQYISIPSLNILGFTDDVKNENAINMFRYVAFMLQSYVKYQIKIFVCDKPIESPNTDLTSFDWYYVNPGKTHSLTRLAYDNIPSKCNHEWLQEPSLAILDWSRTNCLQMNAAEEIGRSSLSIYHALEQQKTPTLSFISDTSPLDARTTTFMSEYMPQKVYKSMELQDPIRLPLSFSEFKAEDCYFRQLLSVLFQNASIESQGSEISGLFEKLVNRKQKTGFHLTNLTRGISKTSRVTEEYPAALSLYKQGCSVLACEGPVTVAGLKADPIPTELLEETWFDKHKRLFLFTTYGLLFSVLCYLSYPGSTIVNFSINSSYDSNGNDILINFNLPVQPPIDPITLHLTRIITVNGEKTYSTPFFIEPEQSLDEFYLFSIPDSERWGVLNGSICTLDYLPVQKLLFHYGDQVNDAHNVSDTIVIQSQFSKPINNNLRRVQRNIVDYCQPKRESVSPSIAGVFTDVISFVMNIFYSIIDWARQFLSIFMSEMAQIVSEAKVSANHFTNYASDISATVIQSEKYQKVTEGGSAAFRQMKDSMNFEWVAKASNGAFERLKQDAEHLRNSEKFQWIAKARDRGYDQAKIVADSLKGSKQYQWLSKSSAKIYGNIKNLAETAQESAVNHRQRALLRLLS